MCSGNQQEVKQWENLFSKFIKFDSDHFGFPKSRLKMSSLSDLAYENDYYLPPLFLVFGYWQNLKCTFKFKIKSVATR